jgi:hypothetical protein
VANSGFQSRNLVTHSCKNAQYSAVSSPKPLGQLASVEIEARSPDSGPWPAREVIPFQVAAERFFFESLFWLPRRVSSEVTTSNGRIDRLSADFGTVAAIVPPFREAWVLTLMRGFFSWQLQQIFRRLRMGVLWIFRQNW